MHCNLLWIENPVTYAEKPPVCRIQNERGEKSCIVSLSLSSSFSLCSGLSPPVTQSCSLYWLFLSSLSSSHHSFLAGAPGDRHSPTLYLLSPSLLLSIYWSPSVYRYIQLCCGSVSVSTSLSVAALPVCLLLCISVVIESQGLAVSLSLCVWHCHLSFSPSVPLLMDGHGGGHVSGEAFMSAPLNCNLATLKDNGITSLPLFPSF